MPLPRIISYECHQWRPVQSTDPKTEILAFSVAGRQGQRLFPTCFSLYLYRILNWYNLKPPKKQTLKTVPKVPRERIPFWSWSRQRQWRDCCLQGTKRSPKLPVPRTWSKLFLFETFAAAGANFKGDFAAKRCRYYSGRVRHKGMSNVNVASPSLKPIPIILSLYAFVKSLSPSILQAPFKHWKATIMLIEPVSPSIAYLTTGMLLLSSCLYKKSISQHDLTLDHFSHHRLLIGVWLVGITKHML